MQMSAYINTEPCGVYLSALSRRLAHLENLKGIDEHRANCWVERTRDEMSAGRGVSANVFDKAGDKAGELGRLAVQAGVDRFKARSVSKSSRSELRRSV